MPVDSDTRTASRASLRTVYTAKQTAAIMMLGVILGACSALMFMRSLRMLNGPIYMLILMLTALVAVGSMLAIAWDRGDVRPDDEGLGG